MKHTSNTISRGSLALRGFTIVELLVASAVVIIMMTLIGQLFTHTTDAVSRGAATGDIIGAAESVASQLRLDADAMVGPHAYSEPGQPTPTPFANQQAEGGILIVVNQLLPNRIQPRPGAGEVTRPVLRRDQLVFIRKRDPSQYPLGPATNATFTPANDSGLARFSRVWYGHPMTAGLNAAGNALVPSWQVTAVRLMLGRQELFLADKGSPPTIHANGAFALAPVVGYGSGAGAPPWGSPVLWHGLTDYAYAGLYDTQADPHTNGAIVGGATVYSNPAPDNSGRRLWASLSDTAYATRAVANYTFLANRLIAAEKPLSNDLDAWAVAQQHPNFVTHCSDFVVEFAGDYNPRNGEIDTNAGGIIWYAGTVINPDDTNRNVVQMTAGLLPTYVTGNTTETGASNIAYQASVFRHDDDQAWDGSSGSYWPHLVRIRYRLHDVRGQVRAGEDDYGVWFEHVIKVRRP